MARKILDTLWSRLAALLLLVALAGLSSGFLVRQLIVKDFRSFISGRMEDRSYWVMSRLEGKYAEAGHWNPAMLADDIVWAYMMGLAVRVDDVGKRPVIDIRQAIERMSPDMKKRVFSYAKGRITVNFGAATIYPLFYRGEEVGQMEVTCITPDKDLIFVARSNRLLLFSLLVVGAVTIALSFILSRRITRPVERLTAVAQALQSGDPAGPVSQEGTREFRTMAETFNRMTDTLSAQESLRKRLLANASHELRTPLTTMRLQVEAMADGMVSADQGHLTALMGEMDRFRGILSALEELSQAEANALNLQKQPILVSAFLEPIVERFVCLAQEVAFKLDVPNGITVTADPDRLSQVVINLLSNAVKAVCGCGLVAVRVSQDEAGILLSIEDTGCGICEGDLPFIFERFYRGFNQGMGIGLAIVKELIEGHGGTIRVESTLGTGTRFSIFLPDPVS